MRTAAMRWSQLALCCTGLVLAGCGSSAPSGTGTFAQPRSAPSPAVFSADLNGLCKQESIAAKRLVAKSNRPAKLAAVITTFVPRFQALTAPGALSEAYAQFLANVQTEINALRANAGPAFKEANAKSAILAKKLHAPACA